MGASEDAGFFIGQFGAFEIALTRGPLAIFTDGRPLLLGHNHVDQRMFGRENHVGSAVKGVRTRRKDADLVAAVVDRGTVSVRSRYREIDLRPFAFSNPVALEQFDSFRPIETVELADQAFSVGRDSQHPLTHWTPDHRMTAN